MSSTMRKIKLAGAAAAAAAVVTLAPATPAAPAPAAEAHITSYCGHGQSDPSWQVAFDRWEGSFNFLGRHWHVYRHFGLWGQVDYGTTTKAC